MTYDPNNPNTWSEDQKVKASASLILVSIQNKGYEAARAQLKPRTDGWWQKVRTHLDPKYHGILPDATFEEIRRMPHDPTDLAGQLRAQGIEPVKSMEELIAKYGNKEPGD